MEITLAKEKLALLKYLVEEEIQTLEDLSSIGYLSEELEKRFKMLDCLQEDLEKARRASE